AELAAKLVLIKDLFGTAGTRRRIESTKTVPEKISRVERGISKELEGCSVKFVGAGFRHHVHIRAWVSPVAGIVEERLDLEFLKHVWVRNGKREIKTLNHISLTRSCDRHPVHREIVLVLEQAIDCDFRAAFAESHRVADAGNSACRHTQQTCVVSS